MTSYAWGCYLVISPDPEGGEDANDANYIHVSKSIKCKDGDLKGSKQVHYVKFGDEKTPLLTVDHYTRANPNIWFMCIGVNHLKEGGTSKLGKYLEKNVLDSLGYKDKPDQGIEWRIVANETKTLQNIIARINELKDQQKVGNRHGTADILLFKDDEEAVKWFVEKFGGE